MAIRLTRFFLAVACLLLTAGDLRAQSNPKVSERDQLNVTVWGFKEYTNKFPVGADGAIEFPDVGRVKVLGLTVKEVGELLAKKLKEGEFLLNPQVTVELEQTPNKKVTVTGLVRTPGTVSYAGDLTLLDALLKSGGRLPEAADEVLIVRALPPDTQGEQKTLTVNARELENGIGLSRNPMLHDGDAIFVRKAQAVTVTGYVRSVGAYSIESGMNVEQVLALAGGVDPQRGSDKRIEIIRQGKTIKEVKKSDVVQPGDIIKVGRRIM